MIRICLTGVDFAGLIKAHGDNKEAYVTVTVNGHMLAVGHATGSFVDGGVEYDVHDRQPSEALKWFEKNRAELKDARVDKADK